MRGIDRQKIEFCVCVLASCNPKQQTTWSIQNRTRIVFLTFVHGNKFGSRGGSVSNISPCWKFRAFIVSSSDKLPIRYFSIQSTTLFLQAKLVNQMREICVSTKLFSATSHPKKGCFTYCPRRCWRYTSQNGSRSCPAAIRRRFVYISYDMQVERD